MNMFNHMIAHFPFTQTQLSHGFPYSDRRSDYGGTIGISTSGGGGGGGAGGNAGGGGGAGGASITVGGNGANLGVGGGGGAGGNRLQHDPHDPLALHQALQSSVDDGQHAGMDENVGFMSDLPLLKSECIMDV